MKAWLALVAGLLAGLAAAAIWTWAQPARFRADARLLVRPSSARVVPAVEALAESSLVEANVAQTLHLPAPPNLSARAGKGGLVTVSAEAGTRDRARQLDAEAVVIVTQKVAQRFTGVTATVLDPAHVAERTSPSPGRNFLIAGLAGLVAGGAVAAALAARGPAARDLPDDGDPAPVADPAVETRLRNRVEAVAKRERALARRAGELAARQRQLEEREHQLAAREEDLREREAEPEPEPEPVVQAAPAPGRGPWTLQELEALVDARAPADCHQQQEWATYLYFLREHAHADGSLPASFNQLVNDVFGPLPPTESADAAGGPPRQPRRDGRE